MFKLNPKINNIIKNKLEEGLIDAGKVLEKKVKNNAPVDTGKLRDSIKSEADGLTVTVGTDVKYAKNVEFGTYKQSANPFFRVSIDTEKKDMLKQFKGKL